MQPNASFAMTQPLLRRVVAGVALANAAYFLSNSLLPGKLDRFRFSPTASIFSKTPRSTF